MNYMYNALKMAGHEEEIIASAGAEEKVLPDLDSSALAFELNDSGLETVAQSAWRPLAPSLPALANHGPVLEQFRGLRSRIYQASKDKALKTILVSSGMPSEGKSFVAANLALSLARNKEHRVLLIDGDLRRPALHFLFGAPNERGLSDFLSGTATAHAVLQRCSGTIAVDGAGEIDLENFALVSTGTPQENSSELVANQRIKELVAETSAAFDWILIDSPPVLVFADAVDLARAVDGVLLVVRGAQTTYDVARRAQGSFSDSRILGVVLNDIKNPPKREPYYNYYRYGKNRGSHGSADSGKDVGGKK